MQKIQLNELREMHDQHIVDPDRPDPDKLELVHTIKNDPANHSADLAKQYRETLGRFATGVTLVTAGSDIGPVGMTVNSFASVSLDPALVLWSVAKKSDRYQTFRDAPHFAIHVLAENQHQAAMEFARDARAFNSVDWVLGEENVPLAQNALARFECTREAAYDGGDHSIIVGRVLRFSQRDGHPLIFTAGKFGGFDAAAIVPSDRPRSDNSID